MLRSKQSRKSRNIRVEARAEQLPNKFQQFVFQLLQSPENIGEWRITGWRHRIYISLWLWEWTLPSWADSPMGCAVLHREAIENDNLKKVRKEKRRCQEVMRREQMRTMPKFTKCKAGVAVARTSVRTRQGCSTIILIVLTSDLFTSAWFSLQLFRCPYYFA